MRSTIVCLVGCFTAALVSSHGQAGILRFPDVSKNSIVFVYAGDLWTVPKIGGVATRLTSSPDAKSNPQFSPDGRRLAFTGASNGIYIIPATGGQAVRVTHMPGHTTLCSWTPDGRLLFMSDALSPILDADGKVRTRQLYTVAASGGLPERIPLPYGAYGTVSSDGDWLAYTPYAEGVSEKWKRNFGGFAPDVWIFGIRNRQARRLTDWKGADTAPMWHGATVYYLSDGGAEGRRNIWSYDTSSGTRRQVTHFRDFDIKWPSIGPDGSGRGEIVFNYGADLYLLDLSNGKSRKVEVMLPVDLTPATQSVDASELIANWNVSPEGERAVVEARGDIWTIASDGTKRRLTRNSNAAERDPTWSPDGRWISFFSDAMGEYELYVVAADGSAAPRRLTDIGLGVRRHPVWSPDSRHISFHDSTGSIYLHTIESGETNKIDRDPMVGNPRMSWSPDSRWLAYARGAKGSSRHTAIWLFSLDDRQSHQVTSGSFDDRWPVFDRGGDYLYFVSTRDFIRPTFDVEYANYVYSAPDVILVVPLRSDLAAPWSSEPRKASQSGGIELQNFEHRAQPAVRGLGRYSGLAVGSEGQLVFAVQPIDGEISIKTVNFREGRDVKTIVGGFEDFKLSFDGKKLLLRQENHLALVNPAPDQRPERRIALEDMNGEVDLCAEGRQIFNDAWRLYRDIFHDEKMNGVDWPAVRLKYAKLLDTCARREDVYELIGEMLGELSSSHVSLTNPEGEQRAAQDTGMMGVDFQLDRGSYRIVRIHVAGPTDPFRRNPLRLATRNVEEGDYLLAVNGTPVDTTQDPWAAFKGLAEKTATLTVSAKPVLDETARQISVLLRDWERETVLRNAAWIEGNRAYVERRTGGSVGYIYLAETHNWGMKEFMTQLSFQLDRRAIIIDARWNGGGYYPNRFLEILGQQPYLYEHFFRRGAGVSAFPNYSYKGQLTLLTNGVTVSGGDALALFFRQRGLGKIIGTRTMGGFVGIGPVGLRYVDGGFSRIPVQGSYDENGKSIVEGHGIGPDIEVIDDPSQMLDGGDPQLDAAIELMLKGGAS